MTCLTLCVVTMHAIDVFYNQSRSEQCCYMLHLHVVTCCLQYMIHEWQFWAIHKVFGYTSLNIWVKVKSCLLRYDTTKHIKAKQWMGKWMRLKCYTLGEVRILLLWILTVSRSDCYITSHPVLNNISNTLC